MTSNHGLACETLFESEVIEQLRAEINLAGGAELFAIASKSSPEKPKYDCVSVACRGTEVEVPALISRAYPGQMTLHNHPSGVLRPSQADMRMAGLFGEEGIGSMIVDNQVTMGYVVVEPFLAKELEPVQNQDLELIFNPEGKLAQVFDDYEFRGSQLEMAQEVADALQQGLITSIEAGTGTGKSLAYLVPALIWARENKKRILVATKTITLQEQLLFKDIPVARKVVERAPESALIKGRQNYVCLRKLREAQSEQQMEFDFGEDIKSIQNELKAISDWIDHHPAGDRAELPFQPTREAWEAVQSDSDMCMGSSCPFYQESPFYQSRRQAAKANLLIVNQALLFSDLALRISTGNYTASAIIPPYFSIILDEAHSLEDVATDHFGSRAGSFSIRQSIGKFMSTRKNQGLLNRLNKRAMKFLLASFSRELEEQAIQFQGLRDDCMYQLGEFSNVLHECFNPAGLNTHQVHLDQHVLASEPMERCRKQAQELTSFLTQLTHKLSKILEDAGLAFEDREEEMDGFFVEYKARLNRLKNLIPIFKSFGSDKLETQVQWLTLKKWGSRRNEFQYQVSPIDVGALLAQGLFDPFHSVVCTSATLNLKDQFSFFHHRSGIDQLAEKQPVSYLHPSPFPLAEQADMVVMNFLPDPGKGIFADQLKDCILQLAHCGQGGTLVLFTSYALLHRMARLCEDDLARSGIPLYIQGRDPRSTLIQRFITTQGVLFGTDTFWEGIDLKGNLLTKLLITKLPFRQMGDPVFEARSRKIKQQGGNDFRDYSLPLALLKFKQGAGRLIRSHSDHGIILVADPRISKKSYGKKFLDMAPEFPKIMLNDMELFTEYLAQLDL